MIDQPPRGSHQHVHAPPALLPPAFPPHHPLLLRLEIRLAHRQAHLNSYRGGQSLEFPPNLRGEVPARNQDKPPQPPHPAVGELLEKNKDVDQGLPTPRGGADYCVPAREESGGRQEGREEVREDLCLDREEGRHASGRQNWEEAGVETPTLPRVGHGEGGGEGGAEGGGGRGRLGGRAVGASCLGTVGRPVNVLGGRFGGRQRGLSGGGMRGQGRLLFHLGSLRPSYLRPSRGHWWEGKRSAPGRLVHVPTQEATHAVEPWGGTAGRVE